MAIILLGREPEGIKGGHYPPALILELARKKGNLKREIADGRRTDRGTPQWSAAFGL
jgi:hypothetical protein